MGWGGVGWGGGAPKYRYTNAKPQTTTHVLVGAPYWYTWSTTKFSGAGVPAGVWLAGVKPMNLWYSHVGCTLVSFCPGNAAALAGAMKLSKERYTGCDTLPISGWKGMGSSKRTTWWSRQSYRLGLRS